jgi:hypothetical protein
VLSKTCARFSNRIKANNKDSLFVVLLKFPKCCFVQYMDWKQWKNQISFRILGREFVLYECGLDVVGRDARKTV